MTFSMCECVCVFHYLLKETVWAEAENFGLAWPSYELQDSDVRIADAVAEVRVDVKLTFMYSREWSQVQGTKITS